MNPSNYTRYGSTIERPLQIAQIIIIIPNSFCVITGNILNLVILPSLKKTNESTKIYLVALAVLDLTTGLLNAVFSIGAAVNAIWIYGNICCKIVGLMYIATCDMALLLLLFMAIDRFIAIVKPLRYTALVTRRRVLISLLVSVPGFPGVLYLLGTVDKAFDNVYYIPALATCMVDSANPEVASVVLSAVFILVFFPIVAIATMYGYILVIARRAVRKINAQMNSVSEQRSTFSRQEWKATRTTLIVTGAFMISWMPFVLSHIYIVMMKNRLQPWVTFVMFTLPVCNSWLNFLVYSGMNTEFRHRLRFLCSSTTLCCSRRVLENQATEWSP